MRESPKLFQLGRHSFVAGQPFADGAVVYLNRYRMQFVTVALLAVSVTAFVVGAMQLSAHWSEVTQGSTAIRTVGNTVAHTEATASSPQSDTKLNTSASSSSPAGVRSSSSVTTQTSTTTNASGGASTTVSVNGEAIPIPVNGSVSKNISNGTGGNTSVHVSNGTSSSDAGSSVSIQVNSSSSTTGGGQ